MQQEDPGAPPASGPEGRLTAVERLLAGAAAGATSVLCTYPLDVVRARFAVQVSKGGGGRRGRRRCCARGSLSR